jgi:hypothetical protein
MAIAGQVCLRVERRRANGVAAESRLLREALSRMLTKSEEGKPLKDDASEVYSSPGAGP